MALNLLSSFIKIKNMSIKDYIIIIIIVALAALSITDDFQREVIESTRNS